MKETLSWGNLEAWELWSHWEDPATSNGVLWKNWKPSNRVSECWQAIIRSALRNETLYQLHNSPLSGGHFCFDKTLAEIKQRLWWPSLKTSGEKHIANCDRCAARSTAGIKQKPELQTFSVPGAFKNKAADILRPVTLAKKSRARYILVMIDLFMKYAVTVALQDTTAATVANAIKDERIRKFGALDVIHFDQGSNFKSELMEDFCRTFMIEKTRTTPYHPQEMDRLKDLIVSLPIRDHNIVLKNHRNGMCIWLILLFVYNATVHRTIGVTLYSMIFGREAQYPIDLFVPKPTCDPRLKLGENTGELNKCLHKIPRKAQTTMGTEERRQKECFKRKLHMTICLKKETQFGCSNLTRRCTEGFFALAWSYRGSEQNK